MKNFFSCLKFSWSFFKHHKISYATNIALKVINVLVAFFPPLLYGKLIDAISQKDIVYIARTLTISIFIQCISIILGYLVSRIESYMTKTIGKEIQQMLLKEFLDIPPYLLNGYDRGKILSLIMQDSSMPVLFIFHTTNLVFNSISVLGIGIVIFLISWQLSVALLLLYPIIYITVKKYGKIMKKRQQEWYLISDSYLSYLNKVIPTLNSIKENAGMLKIEKDFDNKIERITTVSEKNEKVKLVNKLAVSMLGVFSYIILNIIAVFLIFNEQLVFSDYITFNGYINQFGRSLNFLVSIKAFLQPAYITFNRFFDVELRRTELLKENKNVIITSPSCIKINNLKMKFDDRVIFSDINFELRKGEVIKICGKNGCGKTTLLKILMKEFCNYEGEILINGVELNNIQYKSIVDNFSYLRQDFQLLPLSIYENLTIHDYKNELKMVDVINACKTVGLWEDIITFPNGLNTNINENFNLSTGQTQKLQFARALLRDSSVFLIDEIFANLDSESVMLLNKVCRELKKNLKIIIIVSHSNNLLFVDKHINLDSMKEL